MNLLLGKERLAVCQLPPEAPVPAWAVDATGFVSITRTHEELSLVCASPLVPQSVKHEADWRAFKVEGPLDFALTGILASLVTPLAKAGISIFSLATYNTDYVLVRAAQVNAAVAALEAAGHLVKRT